MTDPIAPAAQPAAPGWYPDGSGGQRWWDGRGWTQHTAPASPAAASGVARPALPEGVRIDTGWVWVVSLITFVSVIPMFFFDFSGYMLAMVEASTSGGGTGLPPAFAGYFALVAVLGVLGWAAWGFTVFAAYRDYKHLLAIGVVRPFHWAFAFIPYTIIYLIGRHVVLRKVSRTAGWPLWAHIAAYVLLIVGSLVWSLVMVQQMFAELSTYGAYGSFS